MTLIIRRAALSACCILVQSLSSTTSRADDRIIVADIFGDIKNAAQKSINEATKAALPKNGNQENTTGKGAIDPKQTPIAVGTTGELISGSWYDSRRGIGFAISDNEGKSTYSQSSEIRDGQVALSFNRTGPRTFKGKMLNWQVSPPAWVSVFGKIEKENLEILGIPGGNGLWFERRPAPVVTNPYPSGVRYVIASCGQPLTGLAQLPPAASVLGWPAEGDTSSPTTPPLITKAVAEAKEVVREQCQNPNWSSGLGIYFYAGAMPRLPIDPKNNGQIRLQLRVTEKGFSYTNYAVRQANDLKSSNAQKLDSDTKLLKAKAANQAREEFIRKNAALVLDDSGLTNLYANPFAFEGKIVALSANFGGMNSATTGRFEQLAGMGFSGFPYIVVDDVAKGALMGPTRTLLIGKVLGRAKFAENQGANALHLRFVAVMVCGVDSGC